MQKKDSSDKSLSKESLQQNISKNLDQTINNIDKRHSLSKKNFFQNHNLEKNKKSKSIIQIFTRQSSTPKPNHKKKQQQITKNLKKPKTFNDFENTQIKIIREITYDFFEAVKKNNRKYLIPFQQGFFEQSPFFQKNFLIQLQKITDKSGFGAEHYIAWNNNINLFFFLLKIQSQKINFNKKNYDGITPLMIASLQGKIDMVEVLVSVVDVNIQDSIGNTALHYAITKQNLQIVKILMDRQELDFELKNQNNQRPIDLITLIINDSLRNKLGSYFWKALSNKKIKCNKFQFGQTKEDQKIFKEYQSKLNEEKIEQFICKNKISSEQTITSEVKLDISHFKIISQIGKGSFAKVYLAIKKNQNIFLALKVLQKNKFPKRQVFTERNVLSVIDHPFIAKLRYAFQNKKYLFLIMDYYPGGNLYQFINQKKLSEDLARKYFCEILLAIEELHKRNVIFRDLKPDNIVLDASGHIRLIDFGLSKEGVYQLNKGGMSFCGSLPYLAPEMVFRQEYGKAIDFYSLGVVLYEMIFGFTPCQIVSKNKKNKKNLNQEQILFNIQFEKVKFPEQCSDDLQDLLSGLLEKDPSSRLAGKYGAIEIKNHPWLKNIDWDYVLQRKIQMQSISNQQIDFDNFSETEFFQEQDSGNWKSFTGWSFIENSIQLIF